MARSFAITAPVNSVELAGKTTAEVTLTVTNQTERALRGTARLVPIEPTRREWIKIVDGEEERSFAAKGTHQYKVRIEAPPDTPKGAYTFRMDFVSSENPDEDSTPGPAIGVKIAEPGTPGKTFPWWIIPVAAVVLLAAGLGLFFGLRGGGRDETVAVPDLKGKTVEEANQALAEIGLASQIGEPRDVKDAKPGTVVDQKPAAGEALAKGGAVELVPQVVPPPAAEETPVPSVVGRSVDAAKVALFEAGFTPKLGAPKFTGGPPDRVVAQSPKDGKAPRGAVVEIVPEKESVVVPNVVSRTVSDAVVALKQAKLDWQPVEEVTTAHPAGTVVKQDPMPGVRAEQDSVIRLAIAKEPGKITVIPHLPAVLHRVDLEKFSRIAVAQVKDYLSVTDVSPNPANLGYGGAATVTVNYTTQHGGKARVTVTPLSAGKSVPGASTAAATTEADGRGEARPVLRFYNKLPVKIDTLLVRLLGPDGQVLQEVKRPVSLSCRGSLFGN